MKYEIHFINSKFFVSDKTIESFVNSLKKEDPEVVQQSSIGKSSDGRICYIKTDMNIKAVVSASKKFEEKYDNLTIKVLSKNNESETSNYKAPKFIVEPQKGDKIFKFVKTAWHKTYVNNVILYEDFATLADVPGMGEPGLPIEPLDKNKCPICNLKYSSKCKCGGSHTMEDLEKGHGTHCENGHTWSYSTKDGKVLIKK